MYVLKSLLLASTLLSLMSCSMSKNSDHKDAQASVKSLTKKNLTGSIKFHQSGNDIKITSQVNGLDSNAIHAIHVHENGVCEGDFSSAGDHFNPSKQSHGSPTALHHHAGDLGNLVTDVTGVSRSEVLVRGVKVKDFIGRAIIIHAKADDMVSQPSGNAGSRIACGVVK